MTPVWQIFFLFISFQFFMNETDRTLLKYWKSIMENYLQSCHLKVCKTSLDGMSYLSNVSGLTMLIYNHFNFFNISELIYFNTSNRLKSIRSYSKRPKKISHCAIKCEARAGEKNNTWMFVMTKIYRKSHPQSTQADQLNYWPIRYVTLGKYWNLEWSLLFGNGVHFH